MSGLRELEARLNDQRDRRLGLPANADAALKVMQKMTVEATDIDSICSDLATPKASPFLWIDMGADFRPEKRFVPDGNQFVDFIRHIVSDEAVTLLQLDKRLKALALQQSTLQATAANLRLQGFVWWLAVFTAALGIMSALEPAAKIYDCFSPPPGWHDVASAMCRPLRGMAALVGKFHRVSPPIKVPPTS